MTSQVLFALTVEIALICVTVLFLIQPASLFRSSVYNPRSGVTFSGMIFLCLTFCWSFVLGCVYMLSEFALQA